MECLVLLAAVALVFRLEGDKYLRIICMNENLCFEKKETRNISLLLGLP